MVVFERHYISSEAVGEFGAFNLTCKDFSQVVGRGGVKVVKHLFEGSSLSNRLTVMNETVIVAIFYTREGQCLMECSSQSDLDMQTVYIIHFSIIIKHCWKCHEHARQVNF